MHGQVQSAQANRQLFPKLLYTRVFVPQKGRFAGITYLPCKKDVLNFRALSSASRSSATWTRSRKSNTGRAQGLTQSGPISPRNIANPQTWARMRQARTHVCRGNVWMSCKTISERVCMRMREYFLCFEQKYKQLHCFLGYNFRN
jgi:hypothetical protein